MSVTRYENWSIYSFNDWIGSTLQLRASHTPARIHHYNQWHDISFPTLSRRQHGKHTTVLPIRSATHWAIHRGMYSPAESQFIAVLQPRPKNDVYHIPHRRKGLVGRQLSLRWRLGDGLVQLSSSYHRTSKTLATRLLSSSLMPNTNRFIKWGDDLVLT